MGGIARVQGNVSATGFQNSKRPDSQVDGALHVQRHRNVRTNSRGSQEMRQLIRAGIEFSVTYFLVARDERNGIRGRPRMLLNQIVYTSIY